MNDQRNPTRSEVLEAIAGAHDKATVREAQRLVRYWVEENPDDTEIPLAAQRLSEAAVALVSAHVPGGDPQADVLSDLSDDAWQRFEATNESVAPESADARPWLTIAEAAEQIGTSPRTVRRLIQAPENAAQTRQETRRTVTGERETTVLHPDLVEKLAKEHGTQQGANAANSGRNGANGDSAAFSNGTGPMNTAQTVTGSTATVTEQGAPPSYNVANSGTNEAQQGATLSEYGGKVAEGGAQQSAQIQAVVGEVHQLRGEIEQLKAFIAGGAMQALNERLATLPDTDTLRAMIVENQAQIVSVAVAEVISATQQHAQQNADDRRTEMALAVEQGIKAAVGDSEEQERQSTAKAISESIASAQTPVIERLEKVLERQQWLEEDNANLRKQLEERDKKRGFFSRLFGG